MSRMHPIAMQWDGEVMKPLPQFAGRADRQFVIGEIYPLAVEEERSGNSHRHYFAALNEAFKTLPEKWAKQIENPEHLRKMVLIKTRWRVVNSFVAESQEQAERLAAYLRNLEDYSSVVIKGTVVHHAVAKSQSYREMNKADFEQSKNDVLDYIAVEMLGVDRKALDKEAEAAARPARGGPTEAAGEPEAQAAPAQPPPAESAPATPICRTCHGSRIITAFVDGPKYRGATEIPCPSCTNANIWPNSPATAGEYMAAAAKWIEADPVNTLWRRWDAEASLRKQLQVPLSAVTRLSDMIRARLNRRSTANGS